MSKQNPLNGQVFYTHSDTGAVYVPLPREAWAPIDGGCMCQECVPSGERKPAVAYWDTLVIPGWNDRQPYTFTVHFPELQREPLEVPSVGGHKWVRGHRKHVREDS